MKLASFHHEGLPGFGRVEGDRVIDFTHTLAGRFSELADLLSPDGLAAAATSDGECLSVDDIEWRPVVPRPPKILCIGLNYRAHAAEVGRAVPDHPMVFMRSSDSQVGHGSPIVRPLESAALDFEGELAVIIGKPGRRIAQQDAATHIAGYSIYNDASVRDWQKHTSQFTPGKNFPATGAFGPWLVTPDEAGDIQQAAIITRLNGEVVQSGTIGDLIFPIDRLIAYLSTFTPLNTGDVIVTGTPPGVGDMRTPPLYMKPGDHVEVEVERIGLLSNPVVAEETGTA